jgi:Vacuolar-sorting-associated 13 protein C-terminal
MKTKSQAMKVRLYFVSSIPVLCSRLTCLLLGDFSQSLPTFFATLFPNVSDAPVRLPAKYVNHTFEDATDILDNIRKFYTNEALKQIYKIIGALDFVGNPTMLVTSFFSGVRDLFLAPSSALVNSPRDPSRLGIGVAKVPPIF